jgi:hypothetical protein
MQCRGHFESWRYNCNDFQKRLWVRFSHTSYQGKFVIHHVGFDNLLVLWIKIWVNYWSHVNQILGTNSLWGGKKKKIWIVVGGHYTSAIVITIVPQCSSEWLLSCPSPQPVCINHNQVMDFFPTSIFMHVKFSWSPLVLLTKTLKRLQPKSPNGVQMDFFFKSIECWVKREIDHCMPEY